MVRFKQKYMYLTKIEVKKVTIPLWFDSNGIEPESTIIKSYSHNSTMVRFKQILLMRIQERLRNCHNSTMVRFKQELIKNIVDENSRKSQFHYGSIQTRGK